MFEFLSRSVIMSAANQSPKAEAPEKPLIEAVENLKTDLMEKLHVETAEEAKPTPEAERKSSIGQGDQTEEVTKSPERTGSPSEEEEAGENKPHHRLVMICYDDSEHSRRAVQFYVRSLSRPNDRVVMLHAIEAQEIIIPSQPMYVTPYSSATFQEDLKKLRNKMTSKGVELRALLTEAGIKCRIHVLDGPDKPGVYIVQKAAELQANMIVIGSRGLGVIRRTLMGSVSDYVLHHAGCATCVVPPSHRR